MHSHRHHHQQYVDVQQLIERGVEQKRTIRSWRAGYPDTSL